MKEITALHHVSLLVSDTARALSFYRDVLGLEPDDRRPDLGYPGAWLQVGGAQIHLLELPNPDPVTGRPPHGGRDRHFALTATRLDPFVQSLEAAGIDYSLSRSGRRALFCRDPDGNAVEIIEQG
jgi:glyoxylase I family protein